jgi:hypothetical protein
VTEDSFWPPHELCVEVQSFLSDNESLFSRQSAARVAVVFSTESNFVLETRDRALANNTLNLQVDNVLPFWTVCESLSDALQPYDVIFFPDGELRADTLTAADLSCYPTVVLPHCHVLTQAQADTLLGYLEGGGEVVRIGPVAGNLPEGVGNAIESHPGTSETNDQKLQALVGSGQVRASKGVNAAVHLQRTGRGIALHLIRYDYDNERDLVPTLDELALEIELNSVYSSVQAFAPTAVPGVELSHDGKVHTLKLTEVPLYSVFELHEGEGG